MASISLGKDFTVSGLVGASELTYTKTCEKIDSTTREGQKPYKTTMAGLADETLECSVFAEDDTVFNVGELKTITLSGNRQLSVIVMQANRSEPQAGVTTYQLTMRPATESADDLAPV